MRRGFTLIELLVVMALIGILAVAGIANYQTSLMRGRDAKRKGDVKNISQALQLYWADFEIYPSSVGGLITPCDKNGVCASLSWGGSASFVDPNKGQTIYMKALPGDPSSGQSYRYSASSDGKAYKLWARLEIPSDKDALANNPNCAGYAGIPNCGTAGACNWAMTSNNVSICSDSGFTFQ